MHGINGLKQNQDNMTFNVQQVIGQKNKSSQKKSSFRERKKLDGLCTSKMQLQKIGQPADDYGTWNGKVVHYS